jgi:hypothetical protein
MADPRPVFIAQLDVKVILIPPCLFHSSDSP